MIRNEKRFDNMLFSNDQVYETAAPKRSADPQTGLYAKRRTLGDDWATDYRLFTDTRRPCKQQQNGPR
jgi:hypothetical protein